jgi:DNA-binding HxlR family transcriptional regulator
LIVRDLSAGPRRFVELQRVLPGISTEQLRSRLNRMVADGMLTRKRYREVPPRVDYALTERGQELMPILGELARWGYSWAWGEPRASEDVDLGAIFRLAPGLLNEPGVVGTVELSVTDVEGESRAYGVTISGETTTVSELEPDHADAVIAGDADAWIRTFSPAGERGGLEISGDGRLAGRLLDGLALASGRGVPSEHAERAA